jgi:hypothetical protein
VEPTHFSAAAAPWWSWDYGIYQTSPAVPLPFPFKFYGQSFNRATICSNGWIALGDTYLTDYRNWFIPGAGAPQNLIAAFWDDLQETPPPTSIRCTTSPAIASWCSGAG